MTDTQLEAFYFTCVWIATASIAFAYITLLFSQ